ncbi:Cilia- and flagella-associated protein 46 [Phytophthora ramorum]|uniref:Cilia- and flagella-associated protein 46 n=1 Tax=Phytophthora ramorum TaxID=164328 RepID=UPI0030B7A944|nr:Cilia- and flagella-associated protein 46 [Phytophthora ramorum]
MALDRELRRLLEYANLPETENSSSKDVRPTARGILDRLIGIYHQTCLPSMGVSADMNLPELLVLTAEAAIFQADFDAASESVEWFFSECQLKNQFYCRAQFVRAHCGSHDAQSDTGVMKLKKVLNAIHFILAVIPIATDTRKRPTYNFLVYNASVTYWQIARQLMKQSTFQFLAPSLEKLIDALKLTAEADVAWLLRLEIALVYAQVDANQLSNAAKTINDIVDVQITPRLADPAKATDESFKALYEEALRIQVHVGSFKDPECQKIVPNVKRLLPATNKRSTLLVKLQCIKSGNLVGSLEAAYVELFQEATGFLAFAAETTLDEVKSYVESLEPRALNAIDAEVIVETAVHAAFNNALSTAAACDVVLQRKGKSIPPKTRVLCQVLSAVLLIVMPGTRTGSKISTRQRQSMLLARRVEGMKAFERALLASKRQQDPELVERVCIYAWNLSLPLVQPHLRSHLTRVFGLSSSTLEELNSLLLGFRARLYLETAKLEVASDFLAKASTNITKALSLDYGTIVRPNEATPITIELLSAHEDWIARPVDTHLLPVKQKLDLKLVAESSPSKSIKVLAMLEQAKDGKDPERQRSTLARCIEMMTEISSTLDISAVADHVRLWSEIASLAWSDLRDGSLAQQATETALASYFPPNEAGEIVPPKTISGEKSLMILEVDMRLLLVEILAAKLKDQAMQVDNARRQAEATGTRNESHSKGGDKSAGRRPRIDLAALVLLGKQTYVLGMHRVYTEESLPPLDPTTEGDDMDESAFLQSRQNSLEEKIQTTKSEILNHLTIALKAATRIGWTFVLENTCIYLWNYHFHIFRMVLESSRASISSATDVFDPQWIMPECVSAFEVLYAALEAVSTEVDRDLLANVAIGLSSIYENTGRLDKAVAIADTFLKRKPNVAVDSSGVGVLHLKRLTELKSRVQIALNAKDIVPTDSSSTHLKVVAYLEAIEVTFRQLLLPAAQQAQLLEKAQGFYQKAVAMWQTCAPDLFNAFMSDEFERVLEEEQQQMELYVEVWVRVGCGAYRLRNVKYAIECAEQALSVLSPGKGKKAKQMTQLLIVGSTWKWFALAELLYGRAILALDQGETLAQKLLLASLAHLVRAIEYGLRGNMAILVIQACEVVWNATIVAINRNSSVDGDECEEDNFHDRIVEHLRKVLRCLDQVIASPEADLSFYGEMVLLTLAVCEKANKWSDQFEICEAVLKSFGPTSHRTPLPRDLMKEIQTASAISGAHLGKPSSVPKSGGSSKSPDQLQESLVQAQILKKVAFSSWKDPPAQLKALSNAYIELDGQADEQALVLVDIAEWLFTNQLPSQDADAYLECATSTLLSCQKQTQATMSRKASTGQLPVASRQKSNMIYSPLWFAEKLLRIFVMRAALSQTYTERSKHVRLALYEVEKAWEHIVLIANEIEFQTAFDRESADPASKVANTDFDEWKKDKIPRYTKPASKRDWIDFFMDYDENAANRFYESKRALDKSMQMLTIIDADYRRSQLLQKYSRALVLFEQNHGALQLTGVDLDTTDMLQEALTLQESCLSRQYEYGSMQTEKHEREGVVVPLRLSIALTKLQCARLLAAPEMSPIAIQEKEMTWYRCYEDSQRSIVEKWLSATGAVLKKNYSSDLPRAMTLLTSAIEVLRNNAVFEIQHAIAQVLKFQCQRVALFHGDDKQKADAIRHRLWTRYTSSDSPHATWVCCHGARAELAVAAADAAAAAAANQNQAQVQVQDDPQDDEEEEEESVDEAHLDEMLAVYAGHFQKFQLIAFEKQCAELLRLCSNELVQVLGCRHPFDCAKNVLKNQSAEVIEVATSLFEKCVSESNVQQLHLRRMKSLRKAHTSAAAHSLPFQLSQLYLSQQSESFTRMSVGTRVDAIVAALPSTIRVLCLHFSPDRCFLYAGLLGSTERRVAIARMEFTDSQAALLGQLQQRIHAWRGKCAKETLAYEDAHGQDEIYEFVPAETQASGSTSHGDDVLEEEFTVIINDTVELLNPLFTHSAMKAELKNNLTGNTLILLLDRVLACLPMEALPALQPADAIARDFSIQILHQRLMAIKKQPLRPNEIRVIVDPHKEDPGNSTGQTLTSVVKQGGGVWKDAFEHGQIPSVTDWQQALLARRGGGLVYVGPNRVIGSCLPLQQVTGMNVALTCQAMILLDHAENAKSARRQSKLDSEKPSWEKEVECDPYARALLLTLCGVNVLAINQWETTFNGNRRLANGLLQNISKGYYVGKALKKLNETTIATSTASTASMPIVASATEPTAEPASPTAGSDGSPPTSRLQLKNRFRYNTVIYGLAHLTLKSGD